MKLSVLIPAYNDLPGVLTALSSLQAMQTAPEVEYLVQDDASPQVLFPGVIPAGCASVDRNAKNMGFAGNCNVLAKRAGGDVLFFVNQDVYGVYAWSWGWDKALRTAFQDERVGIVGARLLFPDGRVQNAGGLFDAKGQPSHRCLGWENPHHPLISTAQTVRWTTGAALAVRQEVFEAVGGFDEGYQGGYFEDVDLCLRVAAAGWTVWYAPDCTLVHRVGSSGGSPHFRQNALRFKAQWVDSGQVKPDTQVIREMFW